MITENDRKLMNASLDVDFIDWCKVSDMAKQADSEEARLFLHDRASTLYHLEEASRGDI